jgi:hypothetical protein
MQIPYDLEFVENRPRVESPARAVALPDPYGAWPPDRTRSEEDAFDVLLRWVHRVITRVEGQSR